MSALELVRSLGTSPSLTPMLALVETVSDKSPITLTIGLLVSAAAAAFAAGGLWRKTTTAVADLTKATGKLSEAVAALDKKVDGKLSQTDGDELDKTIDKIKEDRRTWEQQNFQPLRDQTRDLARDIKHLSELRAGDRPRSRSHPKSGPG